MSTKITLPRLGDGTWLQGSPGRPMGREHAPGATVSVADDDFLAYRGTVRDDAALRQVASLPRLRTLDLLGGAFGAASLELVASNTTLRTFHATQVPLSPDHLEALSRAASLQRLRLQAVGIGDEHLPAIARLSRLQSLGLRGGARDGEVSRLTDRLWGALAALVELTDCSLEVQPRLSGKGLSALASVSSLGRFACSLCDKLEDAPFEQFPVFSRLEVLQLATSPRLGDGVLRAAARQPALRELHLMGLRDLTAQGLAALEACPSLQTLSLPTARVARGLTARAVAALQKARPGLQISRS